MIDDKGETEWKLCVKGNTWWLYFFRRTTFLASQAVMFFLHFLILEPAACLEQLNIFQKQGQIHLVLRGLLYLTTTEKHSNNQK